MNEKYRISRRIKVTPHFQLKELASPDNGEIYLNDLFWQTMELVECLRLMYGSRLKVNSGHRSVSHNQKVGGANRSMHLDFAIDLAPLRSDFPKKLERQAQILILGEHAETLGFDGIGLYDEFIHLDRRGLVERPRARWNERTV